MDKKIGGFFPLDLPLPKVSQNILALWQASEYSHLFFANGRSALNHLLKLKNTKTLWLPAYSCTSLTEAAQNTGASLRFFPITEQLSPDCGYLKKNIKSKDAVLAIDYFGRNPDVAFTHLVNEYSDIDWIEDRAQALSPGTSPWGDFIIYSPRKLLGVPDGGVLVSRKSKLPEVKQALNPDADFIKPSLLRYEDKEEAHNNIWHAANSAHEKSMVASNFPMSRISRDILAATKPAPLISARKANYRVLMKALQNIALLPDDDTSFTPLGFPIRLKNRQKVATFLHTNGIFAAIHWPELLCSPNEFAFEHELKTHILTLPCDHRYDKSDMEKIASLTQEAIA